jgi:threonine synthase
VCYVSTRGSAPELDFADVLLTGLARDGGLYVPAEWPRFSADDIRALRGLAYDEIAARVFAPFVGDAVAEEDLRRICAETYAPFRHSAVAPLVELAPNEWLLELFYGPTIAFKDYAMQLLGRLFDNVLKQRGRRLTIVGATSGDTGSAAIEACRGSERIDIFILFPRGRVSEVQRRQMTTVDAPNVHCIAVDGNFDDCQDLVKAMFNDLAFRDEFSLSAVNSINWARVMGQIAYYFTAAVALGAPDREIGFAVPTGNFGNVYAGYAARQMGLPVGHLVIGSNRNDILTRFFESGEMALADVEPTMSPSMDIQVSSNFERVLFDLFERDGARLAQRMQEFRLSGAIGVDEAQLGRFRGSFSAHRVSEAGTLDAMATLYRETGLLIDPHSVIGIAAARACRVDATLPYVCLGTAHPAKFPDAVERATGVRPDLPPFLADLMSREERSAELPADLEAVQAFVRARAAKADA